MPSNNNSTILLSLCATNLQAQRVRWETSKVVGSPDPPLPFEVEEVFGGVRNQEPEERDPGQP